MFTKCDFLKYFYGKQYNRCYVNKKKSKIFCHIYYEMAIRFGKLRHDAKFEKS